MFYHYHPAVFELRKREQLRKLKEIQLQFYSGEIVRLAFQSLRMKKVAQRIRSFVL